MFYLGKKYATQANSELKGTVEKSKTTKVEYDDTGFAHLTDLNGLDVRTVSLGQGYLAYNFFDASTGQEFFCVSLNDVAQMANGVQMGTDVRLSLVDSSNSMPKATYALSQGDFIDETLSLSFQSGKTKVLLYSDRCNQALLVGSGLEEFEDEELMEQVGYADEDGEDAAAAKDKQYDMNIEPAIENLENEPQDDDEDTNIFDRGLLLRQREGTSSNTAGANDVDALVADPSARVKVVKKSTASRRGTNRKKADIAKRNHDKYIALRVAHQAGRRIEASNTTVELCTGDGCNATGNLSEEPEVSFIYNFLTLLLIYASSSSTLLCIPPLGSTVQDLPGRLSAYGESCDASVDGGHCASGICRADNKCGCLEDQDCPSSDQVCYSVDKTCYYTTGLPVSDTTSTTSCDNTEVDSDGSAGDLTVGTDSNGDLMLTLDGSPVSALFLGDTLGTAHDATTIIENVNEFSIPAGAIVKVNGTVIIRAKRMIINGTLDGSGGGYPGAPASRTANGQHADSGSSPSGTSGHGGGGKRDGRDFPHGGGGGGRSE